MPFRPLPAALAKVAKEELFEDPDRNEEDVRALREWAQKQPHLKARLEDQFLLTFVRANKHNLERAKKKLDLYYTFRTALPEIFKRRRIDDPKLWETLKLGLYISPSKTLGEDGPRISIVRPGILDPRKYSIYDTVRTVSVMHDMKLINDDHSVTAGSVEIIDCAGMSMAHLLQLDIIFLKKMAIWFGEGCFLRLKSIHFINMPPALEKLFNLFKSFMNEKQKSRMYVHSSMESLFKHIPQKMLPKEYGGENGSLEVFLKEFDELLEVYRGYILEQENYGTVEALRSPDSKFNPEALFGVDGSFRMLEVD